MSFLSPLFLLLAGAAAVPLLIHLMRRRIGVRIDFPAVRYLARAEREHSRRLKLHNLLLMFLRIAAVLFVALAAARPVARLGGFGGATGHAPTALAIVLDNSLSTSAIVDGRSVLDRLQEIARSTIDMSTAGDRLWLVTADGQVTGGTAATLSQAVAAVEPLSGAGDPARALARAVSLVREARLPAAQVALLTDAQATTWSRPLALDDIDIAVYAPALPPPANRAVVRAAADPQRWTPRGAVTARILAADSATYRITLVGPDGAVRTLARGTAGAAGGDSGTLLVRASPPERGWIAGAVELEPDELRADDVGHFAVWIGAPPTVVLRPSAGPFASSAVASLVDAGRLARGGQIAFGAADDIESLPALLTAPTDPVRLGAANRALERLGIPWRFGAARRPAAGENVRGDRLENVGVSLRYVLTATDGGGDTLATAGGDPWVVAGDGYVLIASPLDPQATSLPVRASFVPWLLEILSQRLTGTAGHILEASPGMEVARPEWADALEPARAGGIADRVRLTGGAFTAPAEPGVYFLQRAGRRAGALVVNAESGESELRRLTPEALRDRLGGDDVRVVGRPGRWSSVVFAAPGARPLGVPFLIAALCALAAESFVAASGQRRMS